MKELEVQTTNRPSVIVRLSGIAPDAPLTPKLARRAARIAYGVAANCTVVDEDIAYRVTGHGVNVRRVGVWQ